LKVTPTAIPDVTIIEPAVFRDARGFFMETWNLTRFREAGLDLCFVQDNQSRSCRGTLRGLHYQVERPQGKLVRVVAGEVFDVAVDLRRSSPTFGRSVTGILSAENHRGIWVPPGFAHGFYTISEWADLVYKCTDFYFPEHERTLLWDDPALGINWPLVTAPPLLSDKDSRGLSLREAPSYS
jgi:dTDP-4-dehydrorhamnose 3,5-epimerase